MTTAQYLKKDSAELHFLLGKTYRRLEQFDRVETHFKIAHQLGWDVKLLEREQWIALAQTGQWLKVKSFWPELFSNPGSDGPEISKAYVTGCLSQLQINDARKVLDAWQAEYPKDPDSYRLRGQLSEAMLQWKDASDAYGQALKLDPSRKDIQLLLAKSLFEIGKFRQAESLLRTYLQVCPEDPEASLYIAQCLAKLGRGEEARIILARLIEKNPDQYDLLLALGRLELSLDENQDALKYLRSAEKRRPEDVKLRFALGKVLQKTGQTLEAKKHFDFVNESSAPLLRLKKAIDELLLNPGDLELRYEIAMISWKYKSHEEGVKWLLSLLKLDNSHLPTHRFLADYYSSIGDQEQAEKHQNSIIRLKSKS
ncbi:tetratricopeptide repeat protein [uncultured Gimesia sp.]|uniref:tetratricopeptide repeat protein n=1 Tax=uncultured Gimesia sp. TaxID=1678688 RepID=UPI0030D81AFD